MEKGERIQYACGHWLVAGEFGIKDDSIRDVPAKQCYTCQQRVRDNATRLLAALKAARELVDANNSLSASAGGLQERRANRERAIEIMDAAIEEVNNG